MIRFRGCEDSLDCSRRAYRSRTIAAVIGEGCIATETLAAGKYQKSTGGAQAMT